MSVFRRSFTCAVLLLASMVFSTSAMADIYSVTFDAGGQIASGSFAYTPAKGFKNFDVNFGGINFDLTSPANSPFFVNAYPFPACNHSGAALTFAELTSNDCPVFNVGLIELVANGTQAEFQLTIGASTGAFYLAVFEIQEFANIGCCNYNSGYNYFDPNNIGSYVQVKDITTPEPASLILLGAGFAGLLPRKIKRAGRAMLCFRRRKVVPIV